MYHNYKVVVCTPAGRRRYMQWLMPFVIAEDIVDRYDIWINTNNNADIQLFKSIAEIYKKVNLVWQPDGIVNGNASINAFFRLCCDPNTIYIRLDDDIVWMEPNAISQLVKFRVEHPDYFLVSPLVINNSLSTYLLQVREKIKLVEYYNSNATHDVLWRNDKFALQLHRWFINQYLKKGLVADLHCGLQPMGMTRFSINSILWFGSDMAKINGVVLDDEEEFLSSIYPTKIGKANCWDADVIVSHFAFFPQRELLDKQGILEQYGEILKETWMKDEKMKPLYLKTQEIMSDIKQHESELLAKPSPYSNNVPISKPNKLQTLKMKIKALLPQIIVDIYKRHKKGPKYIL